MLKFWKWGVDFVVNLLDYVQEKEESAAIKRHAVIKKTTAKMAREIEKLEREAEEIETIYFS